MMSFWVVPGERVALDAVLLGDRRVEGEQPGRGGVDRHRRVHLVERDAVEQGVHVALVGDRDADLADLAAGELVVGVVAGLGGQVEGDREAGLALGQVLAVELVGAAGVGVPGVGAHHPRPVPLGQAVLAHAPDDICPRGKTPFNCSQKHLLPVPVFRVGRDEIAIHSRVPGRDDRPARGRRAGRGGPDRHLPQRHGDPGQRGEPVKLSGERCGRGGSDHAFRIVVGKRTRECSYRTHRLRPRPRDLGDGAPAQQHPESGPPEGLPGADPALGRRRPLPAARLPAAAQGPAPQDPRRRQLRIPADRQEREDDPGRRQSEQAAAARLQRHRRARQGPLPDPRLRRQGAGRRLHRPRRAATCRGAPRASRSGRRRTPRAPRRASTTSSSGSRTRPSSASRATGAMCG